MEKESNALSELSEEQRDEINEAVCARRAFFLVASLMYSLSSFLCSISTETDIWTITRFASR